MFYLLSSSKHRILLIRCGVYSRAAFIVFLLPSAAFDRGRRLFEECKNEIDFFQEAVKQFFNCSQAVNSFTTYAESRRICLLVYFHCF